jgi:5-methylcytosine-specific restriction endonuclease McrA
MAAVVAEYLGVDVLGGSVLHKRSTPRNNHSYHGIWLMTAVTLDHIEPLAKHHDDSDENLVTCCWSCNFGKYHYTLQDLTLNGPKKGRGTTTRWSGTQDMLSIPFRP